MQQISPLDECVEMVLFHVVLGSFQSWYTVTETKVFFKIHAPHQTFLFVGRIKEDYWFLNIISLQVWYYSS